MLNENLFISLIEKASLAPSADNMQPWEFRKQTNTIEVFPAVSRKLPNDVMDMFTWIGIGAAIQNIVISASEYELDAYVHYTHSLHIDKPIAIVSFVSANKENNLAKYVNSRCTNRHPFSNKPIDADTIKTLNKSIRGIQASMHWITAVSDFSRLATMDAHSSYIRLEHKPLHDELFSILRFTKKDMEKKRFGLTFKSLGVPAYAVLCAKLLQFWSINQLVSKIGIGRLVAKQLSEKLQATGGICLITAAEQSAASYIEAGRAMEQCWLTATSLGLSVQPYGVLPQYLTKIEHEPETFLPQHITDIEKHRKPFYKLFPKAKSEHPAIVLRMGWATKQSARSEARLSIDTLEKK